MPTAAHDADMVADLSDDGEVTADHQPGPAMIPMHLGQQVESLSLEGDVEPRVGSRQCLS